MKQTRVQLSYYDTFGLGYLREKDVENYIFELIPTLPRLGQLQEEFYPFYVFTAVRKFFFFLDQQRTGKISIRDILQSPILLELFELRTPELPEQDAALKNFAVGETNWFSVESSLRVYGLYLGRVDGFVGRTRSSFLFNSPPQNWTSTRTGCSPRKNWEDE